MFSRVRKLLPAGVKQRVVSRLHEEGFCRAHEREPVDLRGVVSDPLQGFLIAKRTPFLMEVPIADCRSLRGLGFGCSTSSHHPFIRGLCAYVQTRDAGAVTRYLSRFYELVQPGNVAELLGLETRHSDDCFTLSPLCYAYPWNGTPRSSLCKKRQRLAAKEATQHGAAEPGSGWHHFGPMSEERLGLETSRLVAVCDHIATLGYQRSDAKDGDILGVVLSRGNACRILIVQGHHRIAALAALGHHTVTIRFGVPAAPRVAREEVDRWPGVRHDGYSVDQALAVFDRLFAGRQPAVCAPWRDFLNGQASCQSPDARVTDG